MQNLWTLKPLPDAEIVSCLQESLGVAPIIASLLAQRGINTYEEAKQFFRPQLSDLNDPFLMKDMDLEKGKTLWQILSYLLNRLQHH